MVKLTPILLKVIVGLVVCATNLYHISRVGGTPAAQSSGLIVVGAVSVEPNIFPGMFVQTVPDVKRTELAQTLWGSVIQILKVVAILLLEKTLTR